MSNLSLEVAPSLEAVPAAAWNHLNATGNPFLRHEFLVALERHGCVGERYGWLPQHLLVRDRAGTLIGATPLYLKWNSYGELVFDWSWAEAYRRAGLAYYPKLVGAVPYSPVTGPRLLVGDAVDPPAVETALIRGAMELTRRSGASSLHWLFTPEEQTRRMEASGLLRRVGCQYHWHNAGYGDFEDFLATLRSERRKKLRRERRKVREAGLELRLVQGAEAAQADWHDFHELYVSTFRRLGGMPTLSQGFFEEIASTMGAQVLLILAREGGRTVASAFCLIGPDTLYGRHWGCRESYDSLHFETCYYQGIEYCIRQGMARFEPGAQGEHKVWRGFVPTYTWSSHWIADAGFRAGIGRFIEAESRAIEEHVEELRAHSPYRLSGQAAVD